MKSKARLSFNGVWLKYGVFLPGALMVGLVLLGLGFSLSLFGSIGELRSSVSLEEKALEKLNRELAAINQLTIPEVDKINQAASKALPSEKPVFEALQALQEIAQEEGVVVSELLTQPGSLATDSGRISGKTSSKAQKAKSELFEKLKVTMEISGDKNEIEGFVERLVNLAPLVDLAEFRVRASQNPVKDELILRGELDLVVYWKPLFNVSVDDTLAGKELTSDQLGLYQELLGLETFVK